MTTFLYIDYGASSDIETELRYSLATLMFEYRTREPDVVVYTDKPERYEGLHPKLRLRDVRPDYAAWTRGGLYAHRIKPRVLIDALGAISETCVLLDADSFVRPGFSEALERIVAAGGVAMDQFERADPYPDYAGFAAQLPHLGRYAYDPVQSRMYNSGLLAAHRGRHIAMLEDAVALIDALLDAGRTEFNIEQIAVSESFRLHDEPIAEMRRFFEHYFRRSQKLYMHPRIAARFAREGRWMPMRPCLEPSKARVRAAHIVDRLTRRD